VQQNSKPKTRGDVLVLVAKAQIVDASESVDRLVDEPRDVSKIPQRRQARKPIQQDGELAVQILGSQELRSVGRDAAQHEPQRNLIPAAKELNRCCLERGAV
jgi:hypothetical protein